MRVFATVFALFVGGLALSAAAPASAEMFTCHDKPGQLLYSYDGPPSAYRSHAGSRSRTSAYAAYSRSRVSRTRTYSARRYWSALSR